MSHFFCDTSALVKRYFPETGSTWLDHLTAPTTGNVIILAEITLAETAATFAAKQRASGGITLPQRNAAMGLWLRHCVLEYALVAVNRQVIDRAVTLTQNYRLRGYDAVQLAAALEANAALTAAALSPLMFIAADNDLLNAANSEGLATDNPNLHP